MNIVCPCCGTHVCAPPAGALTAKQKQLLDYIKSYVRENGIAPSYEDMLGAMGLRSKSGIHRLVAALRERGHINAIPNRARAIEIIDGYAV